MIRLPRVKKAVKDLSRYPPEIVFQIPDDLPLKTIVNLATFHHCEDITCESSEYLGLTDEDRAHAERFDQCVLNHIPFRHTFPSLKWLCSIISLQSMWEGLYPVGTIRHRDIIEIWRSGWWGSQGKCSSKFILLSENYLYVRKHVEAAYIYIYILCWQDSPLQRLCSFNEVILTPTSIIDRIDYYKSKRYCLLLELLVTTCQILPTADEIIRELGDSVRDGL